MDPSSPIDLAFFYLYDYTTPPRARKHRRHASTFSPCPSAHLDKATSRRLTHLEAKRTKLATHNEQIRHVLAQYKLPVGPKRLDDLLVRMARADGNREAILKSTAETCGRKVEEAKIRARKVKRERDEIAKLASRGILERLELAEKRREELLSARQRKSSPKRVSEAERLSAAIKIQRVWRKRRMQTTVEEFRKVGVTIESVARQPFEIVVRQFEAVSTVRAATRLLTVVGLIEGNTLEKEKEGAVRTFLSAYMILGHTSEVLHSHDQPLEMVSRPPHSSDIQNLIAKARMFLDAIETLTHTALPVPNLLVKWECYLTAFRSWKSHDASILVDLLVNKFVELDAMLHDIQEASSMAPVLEDYTEAIKSGQMLLLSKIRRLAGDETRNIVRRALQAARRRRTGQVQVALAPIHLAPAVDQGSPKEEVILVEPPRSSAMSNRRIMHELAINPDFEIAPPPQAEEQHRREEAIKTAFCQSLSMSLRGGDQSLLPGLVREIKGRLLSLLQPSTPSYTALLEHLDNVIVQQECRRGLFDLVAFVSYVLEMMRQFCAPIRDAEVAAIANILGTDTIDTFIQKIKRINEVLSSMALDSANFHLRIAKPALLAQTISYERIKFAEDLDSGRITLGKTTPWLELSIQSLLESSIEHPSTAHIWRHALTELLFSSTDIPETLQFDTERILSLRTKIINTITLAALLLIARTFSASTSRVIDWDVVYHRIKAIQDSSAENVFAEINRFIGTPIKRDLLLSMIRRVQSDERDPCVLLLKRKLKNVLGTVLQGTEVSRSQSLGLDEVESDIKEIASLVVVIGRVNWNCYGDWYEMITRDYFCRREAGTVTTV